MKLEMRFLAARLEDSIVKFEQAQSTFGTVKKQLIQRYLGDGVATSDAEVRASAHRIVKDAATDCAYFRDRAIMYASAIQALDIARGKDARDG